MLFSRLKKSRKMPNAADAGTIITGNIRSENGWTVSGTLIGDLVALGDVVVGTSAEVRGNVTGMNVWIAGKVNGHVEAKHHLHLASSCSIDGSISYQTIQIEEGAHVSGDMELAQQSAVEAAEANVSVPSLTRLPVREHGPSDVRTDDPSQARSQPRLHPHANGHMRAHAHSPSRPHAHAHAHPHAHLHAHVHARSEEEAPTSGPNPFTVLPLKDESPIPVRHKRLMIQ